MDESTQEGDDSSHVVPSIPKVIHTGKHTGSLRRRAPKLDVPATVGSLSVSLLLSLSFLSRWRYIYIYIYISLLSRIPSFPHQHSSPPLASSHLLSPPLASCTDSHTNLTNLDLRLAGEPCSLAALPSREVLWPRRPCRAHGAVLAASHRSEALYSAHWRGAEAFACHFSPESTGGL